MISLNTNRQRFLKMVALFFSSILILAGCGGGNSNNDQSTPSRAEGMLTLATDEAAFEAAVKQGLGDQQRNALPFSTPQQLDFINAPIAIAAAPEADASGNFTRTYTLEENVDEADIVKYNGELLMVARYGGFSCCPVCSCIQPTQQQDSASVEVYRADVAAASVSPVSAINLGDNVQVTGMYIQNTNTLAVLGTNNRYSSYGDDWISPSVWLNGTTLVSLYDLEDAEQPQQSWRAEFDGSLVESRRIGDTLYLVSRYTPNIEGLDYYYVAEPERQATNQTTIDDTPIDTLIPKLRIAGVETDLVNPTDCYVPSSNAPEASQANGAITTIVAIPLNDPSNLRSTCYTGSANGLYMSLQSLYLVEQTYEFGDGAADASYRESILIHKFALDGTRTEYRGSGQVEGVLGGRNAIDFRFSEHNGDLRMISSRYDYGQNDPALSEEADSIDHYLTILRESENRVELVEVATLPNSDRPAEIGKPNEQLYGVRFAGDRAYLVTFEQIDPLYVLDLSDPAQPRIAGELEVPGFSDFIHPVSDDLLLTLGKDATPSENGQWTFFDGLKIELFDVSDISNPLSVTRLSIGDRYTDSEALYDRHAFTYAVTSDSSHRFAIPIDVHTRSADGNYPQWTNSGLHLFELQDVDTPAAAKLVSQGEMRTQEADGDQIQYYGQRRSIFQEDAVFFVDQQGIWSAFWSNPDLLNGPVTQP